MDGTRVYILGFASEEMADKASQLIRDRVETPQTILEAREKWELLRHDSAGDFEEYQRKIKNLPPNVRKVVSVGEDTDGTLETLSDFREIRAWLGS